MDLWEACKARFYSGVILDFSNTFNITQLQACAVPSRSYVYRIHRCWLMHVCSLQVALRPCSGYCAGRRFEWMICGVMGCPHKGPREGLRELQAFLNSKLRWTATLHRHPHGSSAEGLHWSCIWPVITRMMQLVSTNRTQLVSVTRTYRGDLIAKPPEFIVLRPC
jgi:hypothetical protein